MKDINLSFLLVLAVGFSSLAQTDVLYGVWVLNEGVQDWETGEMVVPASVGVYDVETAVFTEVMQFDSANFTTDIVIDGDFAYVGADDRIVKIDLDSHEVVAEAWVQGVRYLDVYDGKVFMTRGDVDPVTWGSVVFDSYFLWFDAETLEQVGQLPAEEGIGYSCEDFEIVDGKAYVAINNGFAWAQEVGKVGVYDVATGEYEEHDLGEEGKNPAHIKVVDGGVLTVNNTDWSATSLSRVDLVSLGAEESAVATQYVVGVSAGCNAASVLGEELVFQVNTEMGMRKANVGDLAPVEGTWGPGSDIYYRMAVNPLNSDVYATVTSFSADAVGVVQILNSEGALVSSFEAGNVPGGIAFDIRSVESVGGIVGTEATIVGEFDLVGKPWMQGSRGVKVTRYSNGKVVKTFELGR